MIGRWLDQLTEEEEDRLLTRKFGGCFLGPASLGPGCLMQVATPEVHFVDEPRALALRRCYRRLGFQTLLEHTVWNRYDDLRVRYWPNTDRANALIRNRILRNRTRSALTQPIAAHA